LTVIYHSIPGGCFVGMCHLSILPTMFKELVKNALSIISTFFRHKHFEIDDVLSLYQHMNWLLVMHKIRL